MITLKSPREIELMRQAGRINAAAHEAVRDAVKPGVTTRELDGIAERTIRSLGAVPNFKGLYGFPAAACISVNDCMIHGIPDDYALKEGDIVKIDLGSECQGYNSDSARTWPVGEVPEEVARLIRVTRQSFFEGIKMARPGNRLGDVQHAIGAFVKSYGFGVPLEYTGHGIGTKLHEDPSIPNDGAAGRGVRLRPGMTLAIEPMVTMGDSATYAREDGWYVRTVDGKYAAHYENTIVITEGEPEILTLLDDEKGGVQ